MKMTFDQYITNPMGRNNAVLSGVMRESLRTTYTIRFSNVLLRENGKINYYLYKNTKANTYYALIKVPSEVVKNFYYDVVIKFSADEKVAEGGRSLSKYYAQFFSNDPAFVFTYAHTFIDNDLFIKELSSKMSKEAISKKAVEKNPNNENGYVKSLYFAYLFMQQRGLFTKSLYDAAEEYNKNNLLNEIEDADSKIRKREEEGKKVDKRKKIEVDKNTLNNINKIGISDAARDRLKVSTTKAIPKIKNTKAINSIKGTKPIKHSKKI